MDETHTHIIRENKRPIVLAVTTLSLIIIVIVGIFVYFFTDESVSKIILWVFLSLIAFIGLCMIFYTEYQRRVVIRRKNQGAHNWVRTTIEAQIRPKPAVARLPARTSWALDPRKWSVATPLPAYSPPQTNP